MSLRRAGVFLALLLVSLMALIVAASPASPVAAQSVTATELPTIGLASPISGFSLPVTITNAGDGSGRLFVVEQNGRIRVIRNGALLATPFLDISTRVSTGGERGLLGLAFPPGYSGKGYFYVDYTDTSGNTVIARYQASRDNPDVAVASSEQVVLRVTQPFANHNGGQLAFSPRDGYLYIGMGDGGSGGDPGNRAQNLNELLGKILRIDVETGNPATYTIPASNPFANRTDARREIWAVGMRNPWRFSFDRLTHDLYIADVGQGTWEEIDFQPATSAGGENYGWNVMEGTHCFNPSTGCQTAGLTLPIWEYNHSLGDCSVTGGAVYRGSAYPRMQGLYFYGDYCSGRIWALHREGGVWQNDLRMDAAFNVSTFGEDEAGGLYVAAYNTGVIYKIVDTGPPATPTPTPTPVSAATVQFSDAQYNVTEGNTEATVTVTLTPSLDTAVGVDYTTQDDTALQSGDYTYTSGHLVFGLGETSKTFKVLINEDAFVESAERLKVTLSNVTGVASLGARSTAFIQINDNGDSNSSPNPIDDAANFVSQHYHDFLNRQSDAAGQAFWTSQLTACGTDLACLDDRRQNVSAAFFLSIEFQQTGYLVYRFEKASFNRLPRYEAFLRDTRRVGDGVIVGAPNWEAKLALNRAAFAREWVSRPEFESSYAGKTKEQFVDALFANAGVTPTTAERNAALAAYGDGSTDGRADALTSVAESGSVYNKQYNPAFVLMQYFGYLRRDPDDPPDDARMIGYNFWLQKLNEFSLPGEDVRDETVALRRVKRAEMVRSFLVSTEYRERFGRP